MGTEYYINPLIFLVRTLFGLYILVVMLRLLFQMVRASFHNPLSQLIVKVTHPLLRPLRRVIPPVGKLDTASLVLAWLLQSLELALVLFILVGGFSPLVFVWAIPALVELTLFIFLFAIFIQALLSWVNPDPYHPMSQLLNQVTAPVLNPIRRWLPMSGGMDFSPMVAGIGLYLLYMLLMPPLRLLTNMPKIL